MKFTVRLNIQHDQFKGVIEAWDVEAPDTLTAIDLCTGRFIKSLGFPATAITVVKVARSGERDAG